MLNIPESVKALYKRDNVRKNFRVQFPGGEYPDITNENVVAESVKLTESLSSGDTLRLGITESPVIEFETVGMGNMYGMTIKAYNEIDVSDLTPAEIAEIEAGEWDGELVTDSDIAFPYFRLPLGVFRVEKCPRSHGEMTHRRVTAYGRGKAKITTEYADLFFRRPNKTFSYFDTELLTWIYEWAGVKTGGTETVFTNFFETTGYRAWSTTYHMDGYVEAVSLRILDNYINYPQDRNGFKLVWAPKMTYDDIYDQVYAFLSDQTFYPRETPDIATLSADIAEKMLVIIRYWLKNIPVITDINYVTASPCYGAVNIPIGVDCEYSQSGLVRHEIEYIDALDYTMYEYTPGTRIPISILASSEIETVFPEKYFYDEKILSEYTDGMLEISGQMGLIDRYGNINGLTLSKESPVAVPPSLYSELWWDEYDVSPIGIVTYKYRDAADKEQTGAYIFGNGGSTYDMTANDLLRAIGVRSREECNALISASFPANVADIAFTPTECELKGLPYLEAGDYLEIESGNADESKAQTYIMRRTLSGIQSLEDSIESSGGDITGETE